MQERVRAIMIYKKKLVLIERKWEGNLYYVFPGGGVEEKETHDAALIRECKEELGVAVEPGELFAEQDFRGDHEYFYLCSYVSGEFGTGDGPEFTRPESYNGTHAVVLISLEEAAGKEILPKKIAKKFLESM